MNGKKLQNSPNEIIGWKDNMIVLYRLSDNGYKKPKFENATKIHCLINALQSFQHICLFVDETNLKEETRKFLQSSDNHFDKLEFYCGGSSAGSFRHVMDYSLKLPDEEIIYFLEDDYLHLSGSEDAIKEGISKSDYVSLYDHNDKYIPASQGGNAFIDDDGGEITKVFFIKNHHWKLTNSTTMSFATTVKVLKEDKEIWDKYVQGSHPNDFQCFLELRERGRSLITPIPGLSTHTEPAWAAPGIDWKVI